MTQTKDAVGSLRAGITLFTLVTAAIHLYLGFVQLSLGMMGGVMFLANAVGYVALLAMLYFNLPISFLSKNRPLVRWALVAFAAVTILGWVAIGTRDLLGYFDKVVEVVLILLLVLDSRQK
jgi:hypothetical protein